MTTTLENMAITRIMASEDWQAKNAYRFHILLLPEEDRSWSAIVLNLPGIGSCGDTEEESIENVKEAIRAGLDAYDGEEIPWKDNTTLVDVPPGAKQRWIILDA
jgi:predicted RNase H-like HicB family nuclease